MKKIFIIAILFFLPITELLAQENLLFGLKGGANLTGFNAERYKNTGRTGYYFGAFAEIPLSNKFSIQPEILYSAQGAKTESKSFEGPVFHNFDFTYLQVPLVVKMYIYKEFAIEAGTSFNFLIDEHITGRSAMTPEGWTATDKLGRSFEFGAVLGVSYNLPGQFILSSRVFHGITNVFKEEYTYFGDTTYNYGVQLGIAYLF